MEYNKNIKVRTTLVFLAGGIVSLGLYIFILINRQPSLLRPVGIASRFGFTLVIPLILIGLCLAFRPSKWMGVVTAMTAVFTLFGLALAGLWASGYSEPSLVNGLLPIFDPRNYYLDALGWLQGFKFSEQSAMRPIFTSWLSFLLTLTGRNLQLTTAVLTGFLAFFAFIFAIKTREVFGWFVSAFTVLIVYLFSRRFLGITFTENLGLVFALLGFSALWIRSQPVRIRTLLTGLFMVSLALNIRPGPFFILIGLLVWFGLILREQRALSKTIAFAALAAVIIPFILNVLVQKLTSPDGLVPFANFAYAFYGLVNGGQFFSQALFDHPELAEISGNEHYFAVFQAALQILVTHPAGFIEGCWHHLRYFLLPDTWYSIFGYVDNDSLPLSILSRSMLEILSIFAFLPFNKFWRDPNGKLIGLVMLTTLMSVPFVSPTDAHKMRLYAAVIPVIAVLPGLGFLHLLQMIIPGRFQSLRDDLCSRGSVRVSSSLIHRLALGLTVVVILSPMLARAFSHPAQFEEVECPSAQQAVYFEYSPGTSIHVYKESEFFLDWMPDLHIGTFKLNLHGLAPEIAALFEEIKPSSTLLTTIDLKTGKYYWIVIRTHLLPEQTGALMAACGKQEGSLFEVEQVVYSTTDY